MTRVTLNAGACGEQVAITVTRLDKYSVQVLIDTACPKVAAMAPDLAQLPCLGREHTVFLPHDRSAIYQAAANHHLHTACPVPAAILKAIEVELGMAVPRDVTITFEAGDA